MKTNIIKIVLGVIFIVTVLIGYIPQPQYLVEMTCISNRNEIEESNSIYCLFIPIHRTHFSFHCVYGKSDWYVSYEL